MLALTEPVPTMAPGAELEAWAASGAMALTGRADGEPLGPPAGLVARLHALGTEVGVAARAVGAVLDVEPLALLGERAAIAGLHRRGTISVGGATQLIATADGWLAVSLARPDDVALVPAWLETATAFDDPWPAIQEVARTQPAAVLVERARLLGLPAAVLGESRDRRAPVERRVLRAGTPVASLAGLGVVELGALWAGPLCGSLLHAAGATVTKVESNARPDGARRGPAAFFDLLNAGKRSVALDLSTTAGRRALAEHVRHADVVVEASRPRALEQLGIDVPATIAGGGPRAWVSITGHGRAHPGDAWVAFGDDAAVAGGLVAYDGHGPVFCADAVADPIAGVVAAGAVLQALGAGGHWLLDVALSDVAASVAGPTLPVDRPLDVAPPRARVPTSQGPTLGG